MSHSLYTHPPTIFQSLFPLLLSNVNGKDVAGVVALMKAHQPEYTPVQIKSALMKSVDKTPDLTRDCISGGIIPVSAAVRQEISQYDAIGPFASRLILLRCRDFHRDIIESQK